MKHTIEIIDDEHYRIDDKIDIKYVYLLGDEGWCLYDKSISQFQQKIYTEFENVLLKAIGKPIKDKKLMRPPAGL